MSRQSSTRLLLLAGVIRALLSTASRAFDEQVAVSEAPDRSVSVSLRGLLYPCTYAVNAPTVTVSSGQVLPHVTTYRTKSKVRL